VLWLVPFFPLVGVILNGFFGKRLGTKFVSFVGSGVVGLSFFISLYILHSLLSLSPEKRIYEQHLFTWIQAGNFKAEVALLLDQLSIVMMLVVTGVGFLIHVYSIGYMRGDPGYARFFTYMNLFVLSMLILVMANNFLFMFLGWEGVGLCSYLLIGFWFGDKNNADAGKKAFIVNRIGDFGFLLGLFLLFREMSTLDFLEIFDAAPETFEAGGRLITTITLLLFIGAIGKSAQLPLYVWLPDAMAGPTPVSSLIHAATMVTAGVYMIARTHVLYLLAPATLFIVAVVGAVTALYSASIGLAQNDIKKVLAYSTISQLGYMFLACGAGAFIAGIFHLMTHAFFKGLLFLAAGCVIHALQGEQDVRKMGAMKPFIPVTYLCFLAATLAITGIPGFSGFFSKDEILWQAYSSPLGNIFLWLIGVIAAGFTSFYMFRIFFLTFYGDSRVESDKIKHIHESPPVMTIPIIILALLSVFGGYIGLPKILVGSNRFEHFLSPVFERAHELLPVESHHYSIGLEYGLMTVSFFIAFIGLFIAYLFYIQRPSLPKELAQRIKTVYQVILNKYYVDEIYESLIVHPFFLLSDWFWKFWDTIIIDGFVNGVGQVIQRIGQNFRKIQTGYVQSYAFFMVVGAVIILGYYLLK